jgi:HAMP domain-containing protein
MSLRAEGEAILNMIRRLLPAKEIALVMTENHMEQLIPSLRITGLLALLGAFLYAIGDVLLLASKASLENYPRLKPFAKLLSDAEKMVVLPPTRLMWGALLGVFATPLMLAGFWQVYRGLNGAHGTLILVTGLLFAIASVIGAFVHGTFYYMGEYVQALNKVEDGSQAVIAGMIAHHRKVLILTYAPVMIIIASMLFSILVASGRTAFPIWMAAINPVTMIIAWLIIKRILPQFVRDRTEGAGFNIAYLMFFACTTITLWNR